MTKKAVLVSTSYSRTLLSMLSMLSEFNPTWCSGRLPYLNISSSVYFANEQCPGIQLLKESSPTIKEADWPADLAYIKRLFEVPNTDEDTWNTKKNPESVADFVISKYCQSALLPKVSFM